MKRPIIKLITIYILFVALFIVQRTIFMAYYHNLFEGIGASGFFGALWHGLPLDLSVAGYLTAIPGLLLTASTITDAGNKAIRNIATIYFAIISLAISVIFITDLALYEFWGFRLDTTPIFYFTSSPKDAMASVGGGYIAIGIVTILICSALTFLAFKSAVFKKVHKRTAHHNRWAAFLVTFLLTGALFIPIRGGFTVSTTNLSKAYFSQNQRLNHAAINPAFSLMYSATHQTNFDEQYRYMDDAKATALLAGMTDKPATDSIPQLLTTERPDIIMIILESFSSHLMKSLGGEEIATNLDRIASEGLLFTNFYANSFRTDRGLVSIISGYPAQPGTSVMKYADKVENLPSIPRSLKNVGYDLAYYYGGDANFTNMYAYLVSCGFEKIISDKDFPLSQRTSKWGANDGVVFNRFSKDYFSEKAHAPRFRIIQTSSSHEPFDVPYHKSDDKRINAFEYADSCAGHFIRQLESSGLWNNTLVILVPDHFGVYPETDDQIARHQIPLIMTGGALKLKGRNGTYASQIDIAATLLHQLGISHSDFKFSKNILNPASPHFGYFTSPSIFGIITPDNSLIYNCDANTVISDEGEGKGNNIEKGKAFLQKLYDDLESL